MKITTWNVNGVRAVLGKGALWSLVDQEQPDILCLQEVKARAEQVEDALRLRDGFECHWNAAQRPGYSGVATYTRLTPGRVEMGLGEEQFDVEGRLIRTHYDGFTLYNVYFPNGQRGKERVDYKLNFYARLLEEVDRLHAQGEQVIITGDFNTAHREIDLANPKQNAMTSGFLPEERVWIDYYLQHGLVDAFRELYPERVQYTWWTYRLGARGRNIGWRLDYFLVSAGLMPRVRDVVVHDQVIGSDHCPVSLILE